MAELPPVEESGFAFPGTVLQQGGIVVRIIILRSPKFLSGFLRAIFHIEASAECSQQT